MAESQMIQEISLRSIVRSSEKSLKHYVIIFINSDILLFSSNFLIHTSLLSKQLHNGCYCCYIFKLHNEAIFRQPQQMKKFCSLLCKLASINGKYLYVLVSFHIYTGLLKSYLKYNTSEVLKLRET
jgi:hypothetical protein